MSRVERRWWAAGVVVSVLGAVSGYAAVAASSAGAPLPLVNANDNRHAAGDVDGSTFTLALRAAAGRWQPEGSAGPTLEIEAFGEVGQPLVVPAPLIRVREGTVLAVSVRNDLGKPLLVHGLCSRSGTSCPPLEIPAGESRDARFASGPAGTYHYWATTLGAPVPFRELGGALIVDPATGPVERDRILVVTEWSSLTAEQLRAIMAADLPTEAFVTLAPRLTFVINGLAWPATERFSYGVGEPVRWRVLNLSSQPHPLHLHGFYFEVTSQGDGVRDAVFDDARRRRVVTHLLPTAGTMTMTWIPERAGNWLFHCHVMHHVSLDRRLGEDGAHAHPSPDSAARHHAHDAASGMAGMVIGVTVHERRASVTLPPDAGTAPRKLTLLMRRPSDAEDGAAGAGFVLHEGAAGPAGATPAAPGPPIVLRRGEPVEITLANELAEATAIHWHGMELDSYFDGVHGWSGFGRRVTPMIAPGGRFAVRFTPPRAGTFIYHTHLHDYRQLTSGLYGPLIVVGDHETYDPTVDHVIVLGRSGLVTAEPSLLTEPASVVINGDREPRLVWRAGARHRVRLVNITPDDIFSVTLQSGNGPATWTPIAKDGAPVPRADAQPGPARQTIAVGETYDFEYDAPRGRANVWLEVRTPSGKWQAQGRVFVR
jgi:FtsP/CotA-like multicopper oxidase with cupredoxin domain